MDIDNYQKNMSQMGELVRAASGWSDVIANQMNFVSAFQGILLPYKEVQIEAAAQAMGLIAYNPALKELHRSQELLTKSLVSQMQVLHDINSVIKTPELINLSESIQMANPLAGMTAFVESISKVFTASANISFLCGIDLTPAMLESCPKGTKTFIRDIKKRTVQRLAQNDSIEVSLEKKIFRPVDNSEVTVNVKTMNVVASATEVFAQISEKELMDFIDDLSKHGELALLHPVGKAIFSIINDWNNYIGFDRDEYFHARKKKENGFGYTTDEMGKAPNTVVGQGRYNHSNQSHYYFADTKEGAIKEIHVHDKEANVQVVRLIPRKSVRMIDLSGEVSPKNSFMQLIRMPVQDLRKPTEYLLPEYVTSCCYKTQIEGIKYYGGKDYCNYVTWSDGYFDVELI